MTNHDRMPLFRTAFSLLVLFGVMPGLVQGGVGQKPPDPVMGLAIDWAPVKGEPAPPLAVTAQPAGESPDTLGGCSWTSSTNFPITILDQATATVGGNLYTFGGVSTAIIANAYKFDGATWTAIAPLPAALEFPTAVTDGTNIFILGGALTGTGTPQTTLYRYNVATNDYTTLAPFTTGTWNQAVVYLSGKIYKFAGTGPATASTNVLEIYNVASNTWSLGAVYPLAISFVGAWTDGTYVYGAGGIQSVGSLASLKTYRYDPVGDAWDDVAIADLPQTRWGAAAAVYTQGVFSDAVLAGGYVNGTATANISNTTVNYDLGTNTWLTQSNTMVGERARMTGAVLNGRFYVVGGRSIASSGFVGTNSNQRLLCTSDPVILAGAATLVAESCSAPNNAIDPGEGVTVSLCVTNQAGALSNTFTLVGTLQASGGVTSPGAPELYGVVIAGGPPVCDDHTFVADPALTCGASITASMQLQDGALNLGTVTYNFVTGVMTPSFSENFDGVTAPALPAGWLNIPDVGTGINWTTTTTTPDTAPNAAFANDPAAVNMASLESPPFTVGPGQFTFRNKYITESSFDGGVLEIKIGAGAYADILAAGGSFVSGGYNATISTSFQNPLAGRQAWSGTSTGGYIDTVVNLPAAAAGQSVQLKWRMGSDNSVASTGWWIDGISLARPICSVSCAPPSDLIFKDGFQ